jgi:hypothetical protein
VDCCQSVHGQLAVNDQAMDVMDLRHHYQGIPLMAIRYGRYQVKTLLFFLIIGLWA